MKFEFVKIQISSQNNGCFGYMIPKAIRYMETNKVLEKHAELKLFTQEQANLPAT
jgi:hypothetical protein